MKLSRKLLPALAMLIVSAVLLTTSSFAWFAMNATANANGMTVVLKSDSQYLLVGGKDMDTLAELQAATANNTVQGSAALVSTSTTLYPVAYYTTGDNSQITPTPSEENPTASALNLTNATASDVATATHWYNATATAASGSSMNAESVKTLSNLDGYVVQYTYYLTMAQGSPKGTNLQFKDGKITVSDSTQNLNALNVLVITNTSTSGITTSNVEIKSSVTTADTTAGTWNCNTVLASEVTDQSLIRVDIFIYFDGNHAAIYSDNATKLGGDTTVSFTLQVS